MKRRWREGSARAEAGGLEVTAKTLKRTQCSWDNGLEMRGRAGQGTEAQRGQVSHARAHSYQDWKRVEDSVMVLPQVFCCEYHPASSHLFTDNACTHIFLDVNK